MKKTANRRYTYYCVAIIVFLSGFSFLFSSCTKEISIIPERQSHKDGNKVTIRFALDEGTYSDEVVEAQTRNFEAKKPATDLVHVNGNIYLSATLEEDFPVTTRATTGTLPVGTFVRVMAYEKLSPTIYMFHDSATYIVTGVDLTPLSDELTVIEGYEYKFAAYSFNTNNLQAVTGSGTDQVNFIKNSIPNLDLLWGTREKLIDTTSPNDTVNLNLQHLFARVRAVLSTSTITPDAPFKDIALTYVNPSYQDQMTLDLLSGNLTPISSTPNATGLNLNEWRNRYTSPTTWGPGISLNDTVIESNYRYIFTNGADMVALKIGLFTINNGTNDVDFADYQFRFSNTELKPGHSYTLKLNFKRLIWAGSNIYWNGYNLTFLDEETPTALQGFQGVFFNWGSLIGISPLGTFDPGNTKLYVPPVSQSNWTIQYAGSSNDWSGTTMAQIPRITGGALISQTWLDNHSTRNYLSDEIHTTLSINNFQGDICKYLSEHGFAPPGNWRMPNGQELGEYISSFGPTSGTANPNVYEDGTFDYVNRYIMKASTNNFIYPSTLLPRGGARTNTGDVLLNRDVYLSGSPTHLSTSNINILDACFSLSVDNTPALVRAWPAPLGYQAPVRCMKLDGTSAIFMSEFLPSVKLDDWEDGGTDQRVIWH